MQKEITSISENLIRFKTVSGNREETRKCVDFIKSYFASEIESGKMFANEYIKNDFLSLVLSNRKTLNPDIILNGHLDVVKAEDEEFDPKIKSGKLYGRGAADMKSQVAVMMNVFKDAVRNDINKSVALMLTGDEELSGSNGTGYLLDEIGYRCKIAIIPDGGHNFELVVKEKGGFWIKINARGKSAHGSRTWLGENAILKLMKFYYELEEVFPPLKKSKKIYQDGISVNLGMIQGGKSINSVPDSAEMFLDVRYSEKIHKRDIVKAVRRLSRKHKLDFEFTEVVEMLETDSKDPYLRKFKNILKKTIYKPVVISKETGASDARFFSRYGIPAIITAPDSGNLHGKGEWIKLADLPKLHNLIKKFITEL